MKTNDIPVFQHLPRPAVTPSNPEHANQRWFGEGLSRAYGFSTASGLVLSVNRFAPAKRAALQINSDHAHITAKLEPSELRELARALIDAAADIEAMPAQLHTEDA